MKLTKIIIALTLATIALHARGLDVTTTAGALSGLVGDTHVTELKVSGTMDYRDFRFITDHLRQLQTLDLTDVTVVGGSGSDRRYWQEGYQADVLPVGALSGLKIKSVKLPASMRALGEASMAGCTALTQVTFPAALDSIGDYAFAGCTALETVTLPASVRVVGAGAFVHCSALNSFAVEPSSKLIRLDATALMDCPSLATVALGPSIQAIGEQALLGAGVQQLDLTDNKALTHIGDWAMAQSAVNEVSLPTSVTTVGNGAFFYDTQLNTIHLGGGIDRASDYMLAGTALSGDLDLKGVSEIGDYALYNVSTLSTVALPASVTWLGNRAMAGMTGMTSIASQATDVPALGEQVWQGVNQPRVPLTVPAEARDRYQSAEQWKEFLFIDEPMWLRGDVNNDGEVNIADVNTLIDIILGGRFDDATMRRADVNEDGEISIADINSVIDIILNPGSMTAAIVDTGDMLHIDDVTLRPGEERSLLVTLEHAEAYSALQCDITLPSGLTLVDVAATQGQLTETCSLDDQRVRTLIYSMDKRPFDAEGKAVLTLIVRADNALATNSQIDLNNIVLADDNNIGWHAADCAARVNNSTGIEDLTASADRVWVEGRTLCIESRQATTAVLAAINGVSQDLVLTHGVNRYRMEPGFYVVVMSGKSYKVAIR